MKEVTLRMRGVKEVGKLLKEPRKKALKKQTLRKRRLKGANVATSAITSSDTDDGLADDDDEGTADELDDPKDEDLHNDERENFDVTKDDARFSMHDGPYDRQDEWLVIDDSDDDLRLVTSTLHANPDRVGNARHTAIDPLIEDSDWH